MSAIARIGDPMARGDTVRAGSPNVFANGIPVARLTDATTGHGCWPATILAQGSGTVTANGIPVSRVGDSNVAHTCPDIPETHSEAITAGSPNVTVD